MSVLGHLQCYIVHDCLKTNVCTTFTRFHYHDLGAMFIAENQAQFKWFYLNFDTPQKRGKKHCKLKFGIYLIYKINITIDFFFNPEWKYFWKTYPKKIYFQTSPLKLMNTEILISTFKDNSALKTIQKSYTLSYWGEKHSNVFFLFTLKKMLFFFFTLK